jgi:4a-hydroxytetrahydrobiopterin dehydratase
MADRDRTALGHAAVLAEGLDDWRSLLGALRTRFATGTFARGLALVDAIGEAAEAADHHPDLALAYAHLDVRLRSHDVGAVTGRDVRLARRISGLAADLGITAAPEAVGAVELGLDTPDHAAVRPFWQALLGYGGTGADDEIIDPDGGGPTIWFQRSEPDAIVPPQRWHLDVWVPPEQAEARIAACLDAGGTLVADTRAPRFWVLADVQGNRACICTEQDRS